MTERYWRNRDISDKLISDRRQRKEAREPQPNDTQLAGGIGFEWTREGYQ